MPNKTKAEFVRFNAIKDSPVGTLPKAEVLPNFSE